MTIPKAQKRSVDTEITILSYNIRLRAIYSMSSTTTNVQQDTLAKVCCTIHFNMVKITESIRSYSNTTVTVPARLASDRVTSFDSRNIAISQISQYRKMVPEISKRSRLQLRNSLRFLLTL